ncbi:Leucine-rich repeat-containing protein [Artemisia annua]|uniref:Leucine-rich repeat-containing protein n=1 Tax=Artemisia annua TaxID=35608 RepID=A0A2U1MJ71_ARTAN|nr:Leucine-rich repeat-containing protein [Artemisia annua]
MAANLSGWDLQDMTNGFESKFMIPFLEKSSKHYVTDPYMLCFRRLKVMKLRYCCNLTTTPDFSEITNLEELDLEGCVNLVNVHPSIGMLKTLVVLNLAGCLKVEQHPSFVSSLINLESLSFSGQGRIQPTSWTSITGFIWNQQHPQRSVWSSLASLHMLKKLNFSYCNLLEVPESIGSLSCLKELNLEGNNLLEVPESIGGLSCLEDLYLSGNNFTSLPGSLSQLSHLTTLFIERCMKLEVLPELPPSLLEINASDCTSLREINASDCTSFNNFRNCPKLLQNVTIDSEGSISKTECLDSSITSQGFSHQLCAFLGYLGIQTNICEFFRSPKSAFDSLDIIYHGNSMPEWFTNRSRENHVKVELPLPSDWCYDKFIGYGTCVVLSWEKLLSTFKGFSVENFDGASLITEDYFPDLSQHYFRDKLTGIQDSYMIWLHYTRDITRWEEAKKFVTFSFKDYENEDEDEDVEVKEYGVRLICDEDIQQEADLSMLQGLPTPTQHGGMLHLNGVSGCSYWLW